MTYLLDTNALVTILRAPGSAVEARLRSHRPDAVAVSSVVLHELYYGAFRSPRAEHNLALVDDIRLQVLDLTASDAREAGRVRAELSRQGTPVGPYDVLIAGQALARGRTLVTANTAELSRVEGLALEDWS